MSVIASVRRLVLRDGQSLTLHRIGTGTAPVSVALTGVVRGYAPQELAGNLIQGDRHVIITNDEIAAAEWPGPPRKGDQVEIDGTPATVQSCNTIRQGTAIARHDLVVRG